MFVEADAMQFAMACCASGTAHGLIQGVVVQIPGADGNLSANRF